MRFIFKFGDPLPAYNRVDVSHQVFNIPHHFPRHYETEVVVGIADCALAIMELQDLISEEQIPVNFLTEVSYHCLSFCLCF